jgi:competence protein ComEC
MTNADYFFWLLCGIVGGVAVASWLTLSEVSIGILSFFAAAGAVFWFRTRAPQLLALVFCLAGFVFGSWRSSEGEIFREESTLLLQPLRERFEHSLNRGLPEPEASLASGIILGRDRQFPEETAEAMRRTSTLHLVAVSGYNITVVAAAILKFLELLTLQRKLAWWFSLFGIVSFVLLVGAPASAVRAGIMGLLVLLAKQAGRISDARNLITFAAALMLLAEPSLFRWDLGFQLSFLATIGILYVSPVLLSWITRAQNLGFQKPSILKEITADTLGAQLMVAPWILYTFGTISLVGLFANIFVLPFIPLSMFFSFLTGLGGLISEGLGRIVGLLAFLLLHYILWVIEFFGRLPFASLSFSKPSILIVLVAYILLVGYFVKASRKRKFSYAP